MEGNDNHAIHKGAEKRSIAFLHSSRWKLLIFCALMLGYGISFSVLFLQNTRSFSERTLEVSTLQSDYYSGYSQLSSIHLSLRNYVNSRSGEDGVRFQENREKLLEFIRLLSGEKMDVYSRDFGILCEKYLAEADLTAAACQEGDAAAMQTHYQNAERIQTLMTNFSSYSMAGMEELVSDLLRSERLRMQRNMERIILGFLAMTAILMGLAVWFVWYFLKPLEGLTDTVLKSSDTDWKVSEPPRSRKDEIGVLIGAFYRMRNQIQLQFEELLHKQQLEAELQQEKEKSIRAEALLAKSRLRAFQSQINSHFLFNTMNLISRLAYMEHAPGVQNATNLLAQFLRSVLTQFHHDVTLLEEFENVGNYVEIQKIRFGERISIESYLDPDLEWMKIPSMCLQPLVENAFGHGVCARRKGFIRYAAEQTEAGALLYVWDDGNGLSESKKQELLDLFGRAGEPDEAPQKEQDAEQGGGIGLLNVYRRLCLAYPGRVTPLLEGEEGRFARIGFVISGQKSD